VLAHAPAALRLRSRDGPVRAEVTRPAGAPVAVIVFIGDAHREMICGLLAEVLRAVTVSTVCASARDAIALIDWTGDHAGQLAEDPDRLIVAGAHAGAGLAASLAIRARDDRWPRIAGQLLIHPHFPNPDRPRPLHGLAPAAIATDTAAGRRYATQLRSAGVRVAALNGADPFAGPAPGPAAEQLLSQLALTLPS
jgi:hypothetical protein